MKKTENDLIIVGCGIIGLTIATLATIRQPQLSISLIDKGLIGTGTSSYSAGLSAPLAKTKTNYGKKLVTESQCAMKEIECFIDLKLHTLPAYYVVNPENAVDFQEHYVGSDLVDVDYHSLKNNCSIGNYLTVLNNKKIYFSKKTAHRTEPLKLMNQMALFLRQKSQRILESCPIKSFKSNQKNTITLHNGMVIRGKKAIFTIGPWQSEEIQQHPNNMRVKKVAALHLASVPNKNDPAIIFFDDNAFLLPLPEQGYWLFSFTSKHWDVTPNDTLNFSKQDLALALGVLEKYSDKLGHLFCGGRVFCDHYSPNGEIICSPLSAVSTQVMGASGSGYRFSYAIANQLVNDFIL